MEDISPTIRYSGKDIIEMWKKDPINYDDNLNEDEIEYYGSLINKLNDWGEEYDNVFN